MTNSHTSITKPTLFSPLSIPTPQGQLEIKNRIVMPPMDQYSAINGFANAWHYQHYTQRALGGVGLIIIESTSILPNESMISTQDLGLWEDAQMAEIRNIIASCKQYGAKIGIQLNHAGRKSEASPNLIAPSPIPFGNMPTPREMQKQDIEHVLHGFYLACKRAYQVGVDAVEIHAAHGYLISSFLSPLSNIRNDEYGKNRARFLQEVLQTAREALGDAIPLLIRISASDWIEGGNEVKDMIAMLSPICHLCDAIDVSSGGVVANAKIPAYPHYQIHLAYAVKEALRKITFGGGFVTDSKSAHYIVKSGACDAVYIGRELLRNPFFALQASRELGIAIDFPGIYQRAK